MTDQPPRQDDGVAMVLRDWGIYPGLWSKRFDLAQRIRASGREFGDAEARLLFSEARNVRKARNPSGLVRTWLEDGSWIELLDDLEAARAHINEALAHQDRNACRKTEIAEEFRREVEIQRLLGLALADRKTPRDVAEIMRIPESEVREIVKTHGPALYTDRVVAAWLDPKELRRQVSQGLRAWKRKPILVDPLEDLE